MKVLHYYYCLPQPPPDTSSMYVELSKLQQSQDYEKALKVTNKILNVAPNDVTAFQCKIVCMVQVRIRLRSALPERAKLLVYFVQLIIKHSINLYKSTGFR